jgi:hypothetical protein
MVPHGACDGPAVQRLNCNVQQECDWHGGQENEKQNAA